MESLEKPDLDEAILQHYGIKGMKWGMRKGSSTTGVSRARGSMIDRNDRRIHRMQQMMKGKGGRISRAAYAIEKKIGGEREVNRNLKMTIANLRDQNARLKTGKATLMDKLELFQTTSLVDLVVTNRPK